MSLDAHQRSLDYCTYCPKLCRHACPVSNVVPREALIPQQKMATANLLGRGHLPWQREYTEVLYGCSGCGACTEGMACDVTGRPSCQRAPGHASRKALACAATESVAATISTSLTDCQPGRCPFAATFPNPIKAPRSTRCSLQSSPN